MKGIFSKFKISLKYKIRYNPLLRSIFTLFLIDNSFPSVLGIDPTNICNLQCSFCPTRNMKGDKGFLSLSLLEKVIEECKHHKRLTMIILHNFGEPLLHKDISTIVRMIRESNVTKIIQFASNGVLLDEKVAKSLIEAELDGLTISVDALTIDEYRKEKGADALEKVKYNVKKFMELKKQMKATLPHLTVKMIKMKGDEAKWKVFYDEWRNTVDEVAFTAFSNWGGDIDYKGVYPVAKKRYACHFLWYYPVINWNGDVYICCATTSKEAIIGNIYNQTMEEIWKSKKLYDIREAHLEGKLESIKPCKNCLYWAESRVNINLFLKP